MCTGTVVIASCGHRILQISREREREMSATSHAMIMRLLSASVAAANKASEIVRQVLNSGRLGVVMKGSDDPQTEADRQAQRCIVASLSARFPDITIIGEETLSPSKDDQKLVTLEDCDEVLREPCPPQHAAIKEKQVVVWVDPLDGTKEFTIGYVEDVTVLVGISVDGEPVGGAISQPFYGTLTKTGQGSKVGRTIWGLTGLGVRGLPPRPVSPDHTLRLVMTRSHSTELVERTTKALDPSETIRVGGCGHKVLLLLDGTANVYVFSSAGTKKWDTCVGDAMVRQLGGEVTDLHGRPLTYGTDEYINKQGLVMTFGPPKRHQEVLGKIPNDVKEQFPI